MNEQKQPHNAKSDRTSDQNVIKGINAHENKDSLYTWEITLIHKKQIARKGHKFLVLSINVPYLKVKTRSFSSYKQVPIETLQDEEAFKMICGIGYTQMKEQLKEKGIELP